LLLLSLFRIRHGFAALGRMRRPPYVAFALIYCGLFIVGLSTLAHFGLLARERVQLFPLYALVFCIPAREKEPEDRVERPRDAELARAAV
jgi:hypothetical protein